MFAWQATVQDEAGNIVVQPSITVYNSDGSTIADIYDETGAPKLNPFLGGSEGFAQFFAPAGKYVVRGAKAGSLTDDWVVSLGPDVYSFANRPAMIAHGNKFGFQAGYTYFDGLVSYLGVSGATVIADAPGLIPVSSNCGVTPNHFAYNATPGTTNMTAAVQAAANYGRALNTTQGLGGVGLRLLAQRYVTSKLLIDRPLEVNGEGSQHTEIIAPAGSTGGHVELAVAYDSANYPVVGFPRARVVIRGVRVTGAGKTDAGGQSGILLTNAATNSVTVELSLHDVTTQYHPNGGIKGVAWNGYGRAYDCFFYNCGGNAIDFTTCYDWRFIGGEISQATQNNIFLSGCGHMDFIGINCYAAGEWGLYSYESGVRFYSGALDSHQFGGVYVARGITYKESVLLNGVSFYNNSRAGANLYSDVFIAGNANDETLLIACDFKDPATTAINYNIEFGSGASVANVEDCQFQNGRNAFTTGVTNSPSRLFSVSAGFNSRQGASFVETQLEVKSGIQYTGLSVRSADGTNLARIAGFNSANKGGTLSLYDVNGVETVFIPTSGLSLTTKLPILGGPFATDALATAGGIGASGIYRRPDGLLAWNGGAARWQATNGIEITGTITGTAVTQSALDTTAGRVLKVGDAGILGGAVDRSTVNANDLVLGAATYAQGTEATLAALNYPATAGAPGTDNRFFVVRTYGVGTRTVQDCTEIYGVGFRKGRSFRRVKHDALWTQWFLQYDGSTALGTVSTTSGISNGALIENGQNANGRYTRFADGTQICYAANVVEAVTFSASGVLYATPAMSWTFPAAFASTSGLTVTGSSGRTDCFLLPTIPSVTACSYVALSQFPSPAGGFTTGRLVAIGRWL